MDSQQPDTGTSTPILTMDQCYLTPYGFVGMLSDILSLYIAICLAMCRRPLYPKHRIRHRQACHYAAVFVVISYCILWKENVVRCLRYWQLQLILYGHGALGVTFIGTVWVMFTAGGQNDASASSSEATDVPIETAALLDDHDQTGQPPTVETVVSGDETSPMDKTGATASIQETMSRLASAVWKERDPLVFQQRAAGEEHMNPDFAGDAEAQTAVADQQDQNLARLGHVFWALVGCSVLAALTGTLALAIQAIRGGSTAYVYITGFFSNVFIGIALLFVLTFLPSTSPEVRYSVRMFLLALCGAVTIVFSDLILGDVLGSVAGVPHPDVAADELARYWFYFAALKIHLFAV